MRLFFPFLAALAALPAAAAAQPPAPVQPSPPPPTVIATPLALVIAAFDSDGDFQVDRQELDAGIARSFAWGDRDGDGYMGLIEFTAWSEAALGNPGTLPGPFDFDRDGDDRISRAEYRALFAARYGELDKDGDYRLSRSELVTVIAPLQSRTGRRARRR